MRLVLGLVYTYSKKSVTGFTSVLALYHMHMAISADASKGIRQKQLPDSPYRSKFTVASRGFPATARLSCSRWCRRIMLRE